MLTRKFDIKEKHQQLYSFFTKTGESLPTFSNERETLLKYKEYTGDRLKNDVILQVLELAQKQYPNEFAQLNQSQTDYTRLIKTIMQPWNKNAQNKEQIVLSIFQRNHILVDQLNWPTPVTPEIVLQTIQQATAGGIKKELIAEIFGMLCGKEYSAMQTEMNKFKFKSEGFGFGGDSFTFVLSKKKLHSVAMFNMGICVAPDDKLWNQPDMWQLIIFDKDGYAHGGCIIRTIIDNNKPYLVLSIQPATSLTGSYSSKHIYNKIIQYARTLKKQLKYEGVLIPKSAQIHSNRSSIQERISQARYPEFTSLKKHLFSDYHSLSEPYSYQNFYLV
ncbi:MAG: hypothetical protein ACMXYE_00950 [Candidatus Woesearchaeota archaeon]